MKALSTRRVLDVSCGVGLLALALIVWSMVDPRPIPVIMAMSVAQALGTLSFAAFLLAVARDLLRAQRRDDSEAAAAARASAAKISSE